MVSLELMVSVCATTCFRMLDVSIERRPPGCCEVGSGDASASMPVVLTPFLISKNNEKF